MSAWSGLIRLVEAMRWDDGVVLTAQNFMFGVKRQDGLLSTTVTESTNGYRCQQRNPKKGQHN
jgi:hypothetical protein